MDLISVLSFLAFTLAVALISWWTTRREDLSTAEGYFLGGRHLGWFVVGGSLFLSNVNAGSLVGTAESVYLFNASVMMWAVSAIAAMVIVSEFILPIWLRFGVATTPEFLGKRFDPSIKMWIGTLLVISYCVNLMPPVLYSGGVIFNGMFDISGALGISNWAGLWVCVWFIGIVGSLYAIFGGLKAIATSDAINGVGLVIGGTLVPVFGLMYLGNGDFADGVHKVISENKDHLNSLGSKTDPVPWTTLFTGMLLVNLNYWGMEQYIIQRTLGAKNLSEGQKGVTFGMFLKLISPIFFVLPGLIAVAMFADVEVTAEIYPMLVAKVIPSYLLGFIAAIVFGAALTSFNSGLNSASTIAVLDLYKPFKKNRNETVSDKKLISISKRLQVVMAVSAMVIAPFIAFASGGFYNYLQKVAGMFSVPIFTIVFIGFVTKRVPGLAAKVGLIFYLTCYGFTQLVYDFGLHFLHIMAILFFTTCAIMLTIGKLKPRDVPFEWPANGAVDLTRWKPRFIFYALALSGMFGLVFLLSPAGIAEW